MDRTERLYKIDLLLNGQPGITFDALQQRLEVSRATLKRDLAYMRDRLNAPVVFDRDLGGYRFDRGTPAVGDAYELPGLWFSADEIHALLTMQHLLENLDGGGLLGPHIKPLLARLTALLGAAGSGVKNGATSAAGNRIGKQTESAAGNAAGSAADEIRRRVRVETIGARRYRLDHFQAVGSALLKRQRLLIDYYAKGSGELTRREVSPQRLVYYRDNWYLDAWCHLRDGLRAFAVDSIRRAESLDRQARDVADETLDQTLGAGYGIFSGDRVRWATLAFTPERARWVAGERWHPQQQGRFLADGSYELRIPYAQDPELVMDILKYGADCTVVSPPELKARVRDEVVRMLAAIDGRA